MKKLLMITAIAVAIAATTAQAGEAGEGKEHRKRPDSFVPPPVVEKLSLTDEQRTQLKDLTDQFKKERDALVGDRKGEGQDLREQMKAAHEAGDEAKVEALREKMRQRMEPVMKLRKQYVEKLRAGLTPDQQKKLDEGLERFRERMAEHRGPGGPGGPGDADKD
jgi:Spy/CpxP family protein refolding chaperone